MKPLKDYSYLKGFNHEPNFNEYTHEQTVRELGYAKRLGLNSCRLFMPLRFWQKDKEGFLTNLLDFVRTAWEYEISTTPILLMPYYAENQAPNRSAEGIENIIPGCYYEENYYIGEAYVTDVINLLKDEPGLLFWDIMNEPSWHPFVIYISDQDEKERRMKMVWKFVHHFVRFVRALDPVNAIGIGHTLVDDTELSNTGDLVDIIIFHDYMKTRSRIESTCKKALALSKKYGKPVIDNEMGCLCRSNPYDVSIEIHDRYKIGWYLFKLMIQKGAWQAVHGICYDDGTIRDPSIVAAISGFFRNRGETIIYPDINREHYVDKAVTVAKEALDKRAGAEELLEAAECIVNLLECGELVPMAYPPSAKIAGFRRQETPDLQEIRSYLYTLIKTIKEACQLV